VGVGCWTGCFSLPQAASGKSNDSVVTRYNTVQRDKREREIIKISSSYFCCFLHVVISQKFHYLRGIHKYTFFYER
jgi:hypothetical protein